MTNCGGLTSMVLRSFILMPSLVSIPGRPGGGGRLGPGGPGRRKRFLGLLSFIGMLPFIGMLSLNGILPFIGILSLNDILSFPIAVSLASMVKFLGICVVCWLHIIGIHTATDRKASRNQAQRPNTNIFK